MNWFTVRVFYGPSKLVGEEIVRAQNFAHACRLAEYISRTVAKDSIPAWMFDAKRVNWSVIE